MPESCEAHPVEAAANVLSPGPALQYHTKRKRDGRGSPSHGQWPYQDVHDNPDCLLFGCEPVRAIVDVFIESQSEGLWVR
jgi:hypothetical protein